MAISSFRYPVFLAVALVATTASAQLLPYASKSHDLQGADFGARVVSLPGGNYAVATNSYVESTSRYTMRVNKLDRYGELYGSSLFSHPDYGGFLKDMLADAQGNIYIGWERYKINDSGDRDYVLLQWKVDGNFGWSFVFDGPAKQDDRIWDLAFDGLGNVCVAGDTEREDGFTTDARFLILRMSDGVVVRNKMFTYGNASTRFLKVGASGNVHCLVGDTAAGILLYRSASATDYAGTVISAPGGMTLGDMAATTSGFYISGAASGASGTPRDFMVRKYNLGLDELWSRNFNGLTNQSGLAAKLETDGAGNVYAAGSIRNGTTTDLALAKFDANGTRLYASSIPSTGSNEAVRDLLLAPGGLSYVTGDELGIPDGRKAFSAVFEASGNLAKKIVIAEESSLADSLVDASGSLVNVGSWMYRDPYQPETMLFVKYYRGMYDLTFPPGGATGGSVVPAQVQLWEPAPTALSIVLSENSSFLTVSTNPTFELGETTATGTLQSAPVATDTTAAVTAIYSDQTVTRNLLIKAAMLASFTVNPAIVYGGGVMTGAVQLSGPTPPGGLAVSLSSNTSALTPPPSVTVPPGQSTASFTMVVGQVSAEATRTLKATLNGVSKSAVVTIRPGLKSLILNPNSVTGGSSTTGSILLFGTAPTGGTAITIEDNSTAITTPSSVQVLAGSTGANFVVQTAQVGVDATRTVTAKLFGVSRAASLLITAGPRLANLAIAPNRVEGGANATGSATLTGPAPSGGRIVALSDNSGSIATPASTTVPSGASSGLFTLTTSPVSTSAARTITASQGGVTKTATLTLIPRAILTALTVNPSSVKGGQTTVGTVTLDASVGSRQVALTDNSTVLSVAPSVTVQGSTFADFQIATSPVTATITRQVTATLDGISKTANVTLTP